MKIAHWNQCLICKWKMLHINVTIATIRKISTYIWFLTMITMKCLLNNSKKRLWHGLSTFVQQEWHLNNPCHPFLPCHQPLLEILYHPLGIQQQQLQLLSSKMIHCTPTEKEEHKKCYISNNKHACQWQNVNKYFS